ncbi:hypothetical protein BIW11_08280 [Tropilaelaps mercedesae]|uniref:Uncharacterized protein n=1 Tax=Tropilaelaps mercedesae TaxID=418985 RepID=A0A1V9XQ70_9ACAR|nr:hypothetical protein BIW11_08280 [Tropilaelaps mercedesae]
MRSLQFTLLSFASASAAVIFLALSSTIPGAQGSMLRKVGRLALLGVAIGPRPMILPVPHAVQEKEVVHKHTPVVHHDQEYHRWHGHDHLDEHHVIDGHGDISGLDAGHGW